jgi:hypothetical protein
MEHEFLRLSHPNVAAPSWVVVRAGANSPTKYYRRTGYLMSNRRDILDSCLRGSYSGWLYEQGETVSLDT